MAELSGRDGSAKYGGSTIQIDSWEMTLTRTNGEYLPLGETFKNNVALGIAGSGTLTFTRETTDAQQESVFDSFTINDTGTVGTPGSQSGPVNTVIALELTTHTNETYTCNAVMTSIDPKSQSDTLTTASAAFVTSGDITRYVG